MKQERGSEHDDAPILYSFTGPYDEEHLQAFFAEHLDISDIASVVTTPPDKRDPNKRRPEILTTVSGTSLGQPVSETYSVYSEYELRELVKKSLSTSPQEAPAAILQRITSQTLQTLNHKAERLVAGQPVEVVVRFSKPAGPRVGTGLAPFPAPPPSGNSLN